MALALRCKDMVMERGIRTAGGGTVIKSESLGKVEIDDHSGDAEDNSVEEWRTALNQPLAFFPPPTAIAYLFHSPHSLQQDENNDDNLKPLRVTAGHLVFKKLKHVLQDFNARIEQLDPLWNLQVAARRRIERF